MSEDLDGGVYPRDHLVLSAAGHCRHCQRSKVNSLYSAGKYDEALRASNEAGKWTKIGAGIGVIGIVLYIIFVVIVGVGSAL